MRIPVRNKAVACQLLADPTRKFTTTIGEDGLEIALSGEATDSICPVIVLDLSGPPDAIDPAIRQSADGSLALEAIDALIHNGNFGTRTRYEKDGSGGHVTDWNDARVRIEWPVRFATPGNFNVKLEAAAPAAGGSFAISVAGNKLTSVIPVTGNDDAYRKTMIGTLAIKEAGRHSLQIQPLEAGWQPVRLRSIHLTPASPGNE